MAVKVITDSTSYIPRARGEKLDIGIARLSSLVDGVTYVDDPDDCEDFYEALAKTTSWPTTSQPSVQEIVDLMQERVVAGHEVVGVFISELMSGTYSTSLLARDLVREKYPDATIEVVDGRSNSMELGYAVLAAAEAAAELRKCGDVSSHVISDYRSALYLLEAAVKGATENVFINAESLDDKELAARMVGDARSFIESVSAVKA